MADPATIATIASGGSVLTKAIGGIIASAQARERAEFQQEIFEEQERINNLLYGRRIRQELGEDIASIAARGVAQRGSPVDAAFDKAFGIQLERAQRNAQLRLQALQAQVTGETQSQQALLSGLGGVLTSGQTGVEVYQTQEQINLAKKARQTTTEGPA